MTQSKRPRSNRNRAKRNASKNRDWTENLAITHPNAAGIDIGNAEHYVSVPPDRDEESIRTFSCFTDDLHAMAKWLVARHVRKRMHDRYRSITVHWGCTGCRCMTCWSNTG